MQLFTGSPLSLKKQFFVTLKQLKQNPFERVLVLIPSKHLEMRFKKELCQDIQCLTGVNFMSLGALAAEINQATKSPPPPLLEDSPLLDFKVKHLLLKHGFSASRGLVVCFKNSFRDLINAEVSPESLSLLQDEEEGLISENQKDYLNRFIPLYSEFLEIQKEEGKSTYKEFFISARNNTINNSFLNTFRQIIFYGFYDLTSLQFEFVKELIKNYKNNTQVYLPYEDKKPAYTFVEETFNTLFFPLCDEHIPLTSENNTIKKAAENIFTPAQNYVESPIKIIKVSGEGEVQAAAKEILELHKNGFAYKDIALTYRGESNFNTKILEVFKQNKIPINYSFTFSLLQKPFAAFVYNLFNLERNNFAREDVMSVLNSPYFAFKQDIWTDLIRQSGVECSINQFEEMLPDSYPEQKQALLNILKEIKADILCLKQKGSFSELFAKAKTLLLKYTSRSAQEEQADILLQINDILDIISTYSVTGKTAGEGEFLEEFFALLKESTFNKAVSAPNAVEAAEIMALRLQDFKVVIILGLNEGVLPSIPQQDPALKEVYRQSLRKPLRRALQHIGYLIHTTRDRYFEENFLFYLTLSSAQEQAILTYKTSDSEGKPLVKSIFITLLLTVLGKKEEDIKRLSRRPFERMKNDIKQEFLTVDEAANLIALIKPQDKGILAALLAGKEEKDFFEQSYFDLRALSSQDGLTAFDGIINTCEAQKIYPSYFSPSALKKLFSCPAKYLFSRIVDEEQDIYSRSQIAGNIKGNFYHRILQNFYKLIKSKFNFASITWPEMADLFVRFLDTEFNNKEYVKNGLYPLLWQSIKQEMTKELLTFIEADLKNIQKEQLFPNSFEDVIKNTLDIDGKPFVVQAIIDRIDKNTSFTQGIAVDYKSKYKNKSIEKLIFESSELQMPLYLEILNNRKEGCVFTSAKLAFIGLTGKTKNHFKALTLEEYNILKSRIKKMLSLLHNMILDGVFPVYPDTDSCAYCKFADICRKNHLQTLKRVQRSKYFKELRKFHYVPSR